MSERTPEADRVLAEITLLLADLHSAAGRSLSLESDLVADLGLDSLSIVELLDRLEHAFEVQLPEEVLISADTPADWLQAILDAGGKTDRALTGARTEIETPAIPTAQEPSEPWPLDATTLADALAWHVDTQPDLVSIRILGMQNEAPVETISYRSLSQEATDFARALLYQGIGHGERIAIMLPTGRAYFITFLGIVLAGAVPVPIYPPARLSVLEEHLTRQSRLLNNAGTVALVTVPEAKVAARLLQNRVPTLRVVWTTDAPPESGPDRQQLPRLRADDTALIQYTSGSTGDPKGVVLTHAELLANIGAMGRAVEVSSTDVFVSWLPLYHDMGLIGAWLAPLFFGFPLVVMSPLRFLARPSSWLEAITTYSGTLSAAPNFAFQNCVDRIRDSELASLDLSSWRVSFNGSEPVSALSTERFIERFSHCGFSRSAMCPAYGLAEMGVGVAFSPLGRGPRVDTVVSATLHRQGRAEPASPADPAARAIVSCGTPLPGYAMRVCDPNGNALPDREEGSVECQGPSATHGYFANDVANATLWRQGWLWTGDLGYTADGELFLTGRAKDLIIRAGRNIHPEELEEMIGELEGVRPNGVAAFAAPDPRLGTERLVVVAETDLDQPGARGDLEARIAGTAAALIGAAPDRVVLASPGAVIRTASGKIRRAATRDALESGSLGRPPAPIALQISRFAWSGFRPTAQRLRDSVTGAIFGAFTWICVVGIGVPLWIAVHLPISRRMRWHLARASGRTLQILTGINLKITGNLPANASAAVVVANHPSFIDGIIMFLALPYSAIIAASTDIEHQPLVGSLLRRLGCVFVERARVEQTTRALEQLAALVGAGRLLVIFPEGSIARAPGLRAFHLGAFAVATLAQCPVVPIGILGTRDVVRPGTRRPHRAPVVVRIGTPLTPTGTDFAARVELRDAARRVIAELSGEADLT